jgi:hypothetical protein
MLKKIIGLSIMLALAAGVSIAATPARAFSGGTGGGGSTKPLEIRVTGYITAIDYENGLIVVGASYYGTGTLHVTSSTKISLDNVNASFGDLQVGDFCEARYDYYTHAANKLACISQ